MPRQGRPLCTLDGAAVACGAGTCGPGTVCDGIGECLPIAPCADVVCTKEGDCWGAACTCERVANCTDPALNLINGPFSTEIGGIDFTDECIAWMVTLRSGTDYLRRLTPDGTLTEWAGVANLNMGEVKVLRRLTAPQLTAPLKLLAEPVAPPLPKEGYGEVAITYTCCPTCGCQANPPQGVARLVEEDIVKPLPIVIIAKATQGTGPFGSTAADAGPQGLTWGADRVLYVGYATGRAKYSELLSLIVRARARDGPVTRRIEQVDRRPERAGREVEVAVGGARVDVPRELLDRLGGRPPKGQPRAEGVSQDVRSLLRQPGLLLGPVEPAIDDPLARGPAVVAHDHPQVGVTLRRRQLLQRQAQA
jgi:hypothetical protein